jgi:hypothetical protein
LLFEGCNTVYTYNLLFLSAQNETNHKVAGICRFTEHLENGTTPQNIQAWTHILLLQMDFCLIWPLGFITRIPDLFFFIAFFLFIFYFIINIFLNYIGTVIHASHWATTSFTIFQGKRFPFACILCPFRKLYSSLDIIVLFIVN